MEEAGCLTDCIAWGLRGAKTGFLFDFRYYLTIYHTFCTVGLL